jgi:hypothetical protein
MLDINSDINSLSNFKRNTPEFLRQLKETFTARARADAVQQFRYLAERSPTVAALRPGCSDPKPLNTQLFQ